MPQISKRRLHPAIAERVEQVLADILNGKYQKTKLSVLNILLSDTEKIMLSKRLAITILSLRGYSYDLIKDVLKVSQGTVAHTMATYAHADNVYKNELQNLLQTKRLHDLIGKFEYELGKAMPPKGADWRIWRKNLEKSKAEDDLPF